MSKAPLGLPTDSRSIVFYFSLYFLILDIGVMRTQILYSEEQGSIPCMSIYSLQLGVRTIGCFEYVVYIE